MKIVIKKEFTKAEDITFGTLIKFDRTERPEYYKESIFARRDIGFVHILVGGTYVGNCFFEADGSVQIDAFEAEIDMEARAWIMKEGWKKFVEHAGQDFIQKHIEFFNAIDKKGN